MGAESSLTLRGGGARGQSPAERSLLELTSEQCVITPYGDIEEAHCWCGSVQQVTQWELPYKEILCPKEVYKTSSFLWINYWDSLLVWVCASVIITKRRCHIFCAPHPLTDAVLTCSGGRWEKTFATFPLVPPAKLFLLSGGMVLFNVV